MMRWWMVDEDVLNGLDLDDDQMEKLRQILEDGKSQSKKAQAAESKLKIHTDPNLQEKYPRAVNALRNDALALPEEVEDLESWIAENEVRLEKLGVPLPGKPASESANWGAPITDSGIPNQPLQVDSLREAMEAGDVEAIVRAVHALHSSGQQDKIKDVVTAYQDIRPILTTG